MTTISRSKRKLTQFADQLESVVRSKEQLKTILMTVTVSNIALQIVNSFSNGSYSGLVPFLSFLFTLIIYCLGVWTIVTDNYPNLILFAISMLLLRFANLFAFTTTDNGLLSLFMVTTILLNEIFVVQVRSFPSLPTSMDVIKPLQDRINQTMGQFKSSTQTEGQQATSGHQSTPIPQQIQIKMNSLPLEEVVPI